MNGAEALIRTAAGAGVEVCFANPGTTEMHLVAALDAAPGIRAVLALFEGVVTGAADGYARLSGKPALTLLHLGPGFANGIANLHNARRASSPIVNVIGDQATWHLAADAPLTSDIESLARPVSRWLRKAATAAALASDTAEAIAAARARSGGVSTLIVPADCAWGESPGPVPAKPVEPRPGVAFSAVDAAARRLRASESPVLLIGGDALGRRGQIAAARIGAAARARVFLGTFPACVERGAGLPPLPKFPYFPEQGVELLSKATDLVLAGVPEPVAFFGYPKLPSRLTPETCRITVLAEPDQDATPALEALAEALGAKPDAGVRGTREDFPVATGKLDSETLGRTLARLQPEGAIVVDEAATSGAQWFSLAGGAAPHTVLSLTGGAIGQGLPNAGGAAIGCPGRRVIAFQADGSAMYTVQSLWTMARENLDVTVLVCANRAYRILKVELARADITHPGPAARALTDLQPPALDFVSLARGLGVPAERAENAEQLAAALGRALATRGPSLVEAVI
ncbi:MAG TPA: acetolactate synthase large subunit [Myxococcota bacterium]|nr:acetolactate synthase large subunit [Myxococcota bacterium]